MKGDLPKVVVSNEGNLVRGTCTFVTSRASLTKEVVFHEGGLSKEVVSNERGVNMDILHS